jgi:hypothetical protein
MLAVGGGPWLLRHSDSILAQTAERQSTVGRSAGHTGPPDIMGGMGIGDGMDMQQMMRGMRGMMGDDQGMGPMSRMHR